MFRHSVAISVLGFDTARGECFDKGCSEMTSPNRSQQDWDDLIAERDLLRHQVSALSDELEHAETERRLALAEIDGLERKLVAEAKRFQEREAILALGHML